MKEGTTVICNKAISKKCPNVTCYCAKPHDYSKIWCHDCGCGTGTKIEGSKCVPTSKKIIDPKVKILKTIRQETYKRKNNK